MMVFEGDPDHPAEGDGPDDGGRRAPLDWRSRAVVAGGSAVVRALAMTWRYRQLGFEPIRELRSRRQPAIYAFWHAQMLPLLALHHGAGAAILISAHRDGERIARAARRFGFRTIRGSTTRGAAGALRNLVRALEEGWEVVVTPDGPRGPVERFAPGAVIAAQQAGVPIVLVAAAADRAWRLRSWDRFMIPRPLARITVAYGAPVTVPADSAREAAATAADFQTQLDALNVVARGQ
jgi:lysophospholipid acyltransferase (LPLAT)-like uncharacterized protein